MRTSVLFAGLLSLAGGINGLEVDNVKLFESLGGVPENWRQVSSVNASEVLRFMIAVKQVIDVQNLQSLQCNQTERLCLGICGSAC